MSWEAEEGSLTVETCPIYRYWSGPKSGAFVVEVKLVFLAPGLQMLLNHDPVSGAPFGMHYSSVENRLLVG